ncbi:hypothetical protein ACFV19_24710 [Streptomyces griseoluteus]|uniref:hypothetical protein n=1 Tax=Streptomyces griseoluteus TaxID=29306 RepID=UPI0036B23408
MNREPCTGIQGETLCGETAVITTPVSLRAGCAVAVSLTVVLHLLKTALRETAVTPMHTDDHVIASAAAVPFPETGSHSSLVYFLADGGRVRIGRSRGLYQRMKALSLREDAVPLSGGQCLESMHSASDSTATESATGSGSNLPRRSSASSSTRPRRTAASDVTSR